MFDAEELSVAAETGDLATIQRFFAQPGVRPALDKAYEDSREAYDAMVAHNSILAIGSALIGDVLSISLFGLCISAVMTSPFGYKACEVLLSSHVFLEMRQAERSFVLLQVLNVAIISWHAELIRLLVVHGVDFDNFGVVAKCASSGNAQVVETLCESGVSCVSYQAARCCRFSENYGAVQMMIRHGMDVQASEGEYGQLQVAAEDANLDLMELYLGEGYADADAQDGEGLTPLMAVMRKSSAELGRWHGDKPPKIVSMLLEHGANVHSHNSNGETALHLAARHECDVIALLLLEYGADPNIPDKDGDTPLHIVARMLDDEANSVKFDEMVAHGGDLLVKNATLVTPLDLLKESTFGQQWIRTNPRHLVQYE